MRRGVVGSEGPGVTGARDPAGKFRSTQSRHPTAPKSRHPRGPQSCHPTAPKSRHPGYLNPVIPRLDRGIHLITLCAGGIMDSPVKPGNDAET